jgi:hypothetical protein
MWHELGTVPLKQNLPVPGTSLHLVEIPKKLSKTCTTWLEWIDSSIHMIY